MADEEKWVDVQPENWADVPQENWVDVEPPKKNTIGSWDALIKHPLERLPLGLGTQAWADRMISVQMAAQRLRDFGENDELWKQDREEKRKQFTQSMFGNPYGQYMRPTSYTFGGDRVSDNKILAEYLKELDSEYALGGRVTDTIADMPAFMIDFIVTGGLKSLGDKAAVAAGKKILGKYATTLAGRAAIGTSKLTLGSALQTVGMPGLVIENILRRQQAENIQIHDDGSVTYDRPKEGMMESIVKGSLDSYIEILSENTGGIVKLPGITDIAKKTPFMGKVVERMQAQWLKKHSGKTAADFLKAVATKTGFNGIVSELGEEFWGDSLRAILDVDDFGVDKDSPTGKATWEERLAAAMKSDVDKLPEMAISFALTGSGFQAIANYKAEKVQLTENAKNAFNSLLESESLSTPTEIDIAAGMLGFEDDFLYEKVTDVNKKKWNYVAVTETIDGEEVPTGEYDMIEVPANEPKTLLGKAEKLISKIFPSSKPKEGEFRKPGVGKLFTPKWLLNKIVGIETTLEDLVRNEEARQLESQQLMSWTAKLTEKLKKEKGLRRIADLLPERAEIEAATAAEAKLAIPDNATEVYVDRKTGEIYPITPETNNVSDEIQREKSGIPEGLSYDEFDEYIHSNNAINFRAKSLDTIDQWNAYQEEQQLNQVDEEMIRDGRFKLGETAGFTKVKVSKINGHRLTLDEGLTNKETRAKTLQMLHAAEVENTPAYRLFQKLDSKNPIHIMRDLLDTYEDAPSFLSTSEAALFNQVRELTRYMRTRANMVREQMGLDPIANVDGYITHWMDAAAQAVVDKKVTPAQSTYLNKLMNNLPKNIKNATQMKREVKGKMEKYFSKDLSKLLKVMINYDLRDIYITQPYAAAWEELEELKRQGVIPEETFKVAEEFLRYDIRKFQTPLDSAFNTTVKVPTDLWNALAPEKWVIDDASRVVFGTLRRLGQVSGLGFRPKPGLRNLGQRLLLTDLYRHTDVIKAQLAVTGAIKMPMMEHPITGKQVSVLDFAKEQDWFKLAVKQFEDVEGMYSKLEQSAMYLYGLTNAGIDWLGNVEISVMTGYYDWEHMYNNSQTGTPHFMRCLEEAKKTGEDVESLLTQKGDLGWSLREAVRRTQWEYFSTSMPTILRGNVARGVGMFQSWWMNYFFNHCREMINQTVTGRNSNGRLLTPDGRYRAVKGMGSIVAISKVMSTVFKIELLSSLFMPVPGYYPPIADLIIGFIQYFAAATGGDDKELKAAKNRILRNLKFFLPFSAFARDFNRLISGNFDISDFLFYKKEYEGDKKDE